MLPEMSNSLSPPAEPGVYSLLLLSELQGRHLVVPAKAGTQGRLLDSCFRRNDGCGERKRVARNGWRPPSGLFFSSPNGHYFWQWLYISFPGAIPEAVIGSGAPSFRPRRCLGYEGCDLLPLFIGRVDDAFAHRTYLRRDAYTKKTESTVAYFARDFARSPPL